MPPVSMARHWHACRLLRRTASLPAAAASLSFHPLRYRAQRRRSDWHAHAVASLAARMRRRLASLFILLLPGHRSTGHARLYVLEHRYPLRRVVGRWVQYARIPGSRRRHRKCIHFLGNSARSVLNSSSGAPRRFPFGQFSDRLKTRETWVDLISIIILRIYLPSFHGTPGGYRACNRSVSVGEDFGTEATVRGPVAARSRPRTSPYTACALALLRPAVVYARTRARTGVYVYGSCHWPPEQRRQYATWSAY
jgi:hypothetical protein